MTTEERQSRRWYHRYFFHLYFLALALLLAFLFGCDLANPPAGNGQQPDYYVDIVDSVLLVDQALEGQQPALDRLTLLNGYAERSFGYVVPVMSDGSDFRDYLKPRVEQNLARLVICEGEFIRGLICSNWRTDIKGWLLGVVRNSFRGINDARQLLNPVDHPLQIAVHLPELTSIYGALRRRTQWTNAEVAEYESWARRMERVLATSDAVWDNLAAYGVSPCHRWNNHRTMHLRGRGALLASVGELGRLRALKSRYLLLLDKAIILAGEIDESCESRPRPAFSIYDSYRDGDRTPNGFGYSAITISNLIDFAVIYERATGESIWRLSAPREETLIAALEYITIVDASLRNGVYTLGIHSGRPRVSGRFTEAIYEKARQVLDTPLPMVPNRKAFEIFHIGLGLSK